MNAWNKFDSIQLGDDWNLDHDDGNKKWFDTHFYVNISRKFHGKIEFIL